MATLLPPAISTEWYDRSRPCRHCRGAKVVARVEREDGSLLRVLHEADCPAREDVVREAPRKRGKRP